MPGRRLARPRSWVPGPDRCSRPLGRGRSRRPRRPGRRLEQQGLRATSGRWRAARSPPARSRSSGWAHRPGRRAHRRTGPRRRRLRGTAALDTLVGGAVVAGSPTCSTCSTCAPAGRSRRPSCSARSCRDVAALGGGSRRRGGRRRRTAAGRPRGGGDARRHRRQRAAPCSARALVRGRRAWPAGSPSRVLTALTLAQRGCRFTRVIESTPVLRELDALGRR